MDSCRGSKWLGAGPSWPAPTISPVASEGRHKFEVSARAQIVSCSNRWERFRQGCPTSESEGCSTSSWAHPRDEPGRSHEDPPDPGFRGSFRTTIPKKWRFSRRRWRRHRCKPEPLQQRHRSPASEKTNGGSGRENGRQPRRCARQSPRRPRTSRQW